MRGSARSCALRRGGADKGCADCCLGSAPGSDTTGIVDPSSSFVFVFAFVLRAQRALSAIVLSSKNESLSCGRVPQHLSRKSVSVHGHDSDSCGIRMVRV